MHKVSVTLAIILLCWLYLYLPPVSDQPGFLSDSVHYLLMAQYFGFSPDLIAQFYFHTSVFPPLFPATIALFGNSAASAHNLSATLFLLASVPFYFWLKCSLKSNQAIWITIIAWLSPILVNASLDILSESLFMVLVFAAFRVSQLSFRRETAMGLALLVTCAILTRSVGIALIPGFLLWFWQGRKENDTFPWSIPFFVLTVPILAWEAYKASRPSVNGVNYFYLWLERLRTEHSGFLDILWQNVSAMFSASMFNGGIFLNILLLLFATPTFYERLKARSFDALFILTYLMIILIWPYPDQMPRFLLVMAPILVAYALMTVSFLLSITGIKKQIAIGAGLIVLFVGFLPANIHHVSRLSMPVETIFQPYKRNSYWTSMKDDGKAQDVLKNMHRYALAHAYVQKTVPKGDCVYAVFADLLSYRSKRMAFQMPASVDEMTKCHYVFASARSALNYEAEPMFPVSAAGFEGKSPMWVTLNESDQPIAALFDLRE